ncbi:hypothetical protein [Myxococcus sp. AM010]|uniref:hypothetical protein n=1 Tax=Myxococcus sp. AM010 TaxID=2745138 RepID=UPI00159517D1|nr:hypothetical protein [Myxococcus sp. AM010]NVJ13161.1 hypothetical protein [Myxococcus sp. AM010]
MSTPLTEEKLEAIRARHAAATPGPWAWFGYLSRPGASKNLNRLHLATVNRGRRYVMDFVRMGMRSAQPRFQPPGGFMVPASDLAEYEVEYRDDIKGIAHPDARFLAASWEDVRDLLAHITSITAREHSANERAETWEGEARAYHTRVEELEAECASLRAAEARVRELLEAVGDFLATLYATPLNPYPDEHDPRAAGWADALRAGREGANAMAGAFNAARAGVAPTPTPERARPAVDTRRVCDCLGSCRGAEKLSPGWRCASEPRTRARIAPTPVPTVPPMVARDGKDGAR